MPNHAACIDDLVHSLYAAAADGRSWPSWLEACAARFNAAASSLRLLEPAGVATTDVVAISGFSSEAQDAFSRYYFKINPWNGGAKKSVYSNKVHVGEEWISTAGFLKTEIYSEFYKPHMDGACHVVGGIFRLSKPHNLFSIGLLRNRRAGPFGETERRRLEALLPHLRQALDIRQRLRGLETEVGRCEAALNRLASAVLICTGAGRVVFANAAAQHLTGRADGLALSAGGFVGASRPAETAALNRAIAAAVELAVRRTGTAPSGNLTLSRPSGLPSLQVLVTALPEPETPPAAATAVLFITDPAAQPAPPAESLRHLFGLTKREAALAVELATGRSLEDVAGRWEISRETLRWHLKTLFQKTETQSQRDLVRKIVTSPAAVAMPVHAEAGARLP